MIRSVALQKNAQNESDFFVSMPMETQLKLLKIKNWLGYKFKDKQHCLSTNETVLIFFPHTFDE